jgi:ribonuclease VapC
MFIDASAIVAMLTDEADGQELATRMARSSHRSTSAIAVFESVAGVARKLSYSIDEARDIVAQFLTTAEIDLVGIGAEQSEAALSAFERFGKGRHPAALNMGDCFAYACAATAKVPLLFKGDDFGRTDIIAAA